MGKNGEKRERGRSKGSGNTQKEGVEPMAKRKRARKGRVVEEQGTKY